MCALMTTVIRTHNKKYIGFNFEDIWTDFELRRTSDFRNKLFRLKICWRFYCNKRLFINNFIHILNCIQIARAYVFFD